MADNTFEKDFGYLMPFLDKVAAAANTLSDTGAREELARLMADEKARWVRIRQLLSGDVRPPAASTAASRPVAQHEPRPITQEVREPLSFTVGSLRPRGR
jgi:hypothetical protein